MGLTLAGGLPANSRGFDTTLSIFATVIVTALSASSEAACSKMVSYSSSDSQRCALKYSLGLSDLVSNRMRVTTASGLMF